MNGNTLLFFIGGIAIGTYFAEPIREVVPVLDKNRTASGSSNNNEPEV